MAESTALSATNERYKAIVMLVAASVLWSFGGILVKLVDLNPLGITGIRSAITAAMLFMFLKKPKWEWSFDKIGGTIAYTAMVILFVAATKMTTAASAILLQYTAPIYIAIFGAWMLKEKATLRDWITIVFVIAGMVLFFVDSLSGGKMKGNFLGVLSGIAMAFNIMFMRRQKDSNPLEQVFWGNLLTAIIGTPFALASTITPRGWTGLILLGVFQLGLSYILFAKAIKNLTALESTLIAVIEPILNPVWVFVIVGELPGMWSLIGGLVVLISVTVSSIKSTMDVKKETEQVVST
jgi:drug/metabolite transporter (DMT)-like permease